MKKLFGGVAAAILIAAAGSASAATIQLYNTGVKDDGSVRSNNDAETHYSLIANPGNSEISIRVATSANGYPIGPWIGDSSDSAWIGPVGGTLDGPVGQYIYRLSFDLSGLNAALASISGRWASDNFGADIKINGVSTNQTTQFGFSNWTGFTVNSGFVSGVNTLDFVMNNGGGPTGLRVELSGQAPALEGGVPEPATWALMIGGFGMAGATLRRRRAIAA